jgi:hypothetical protein
MSEDEDAKSCHSDQKIKDLVLPTNLSGTETAQKRAGWGPVLPPASASNAVPANCCGT